MKSKPKAILALLILVFLAWFFLGRADPPGLVVTPASPLGASETSPPASPPTKRRVALPRPKLPTRTGSDASATGQAQGTEASPPVTPPPEAEPPKPAPRGYPIPVPSDMTTVAINDTIRTTLSEMTRCLQSWGELDGTFSGSVKMGFELGPTGLSDVWIDEVDNVPSGPLTCLGGTIWEAPWPSFQEETTVSYPFQVEITDDEDTGS